MYGAEGSYILDREASVPYVIATVLCHLSVPEITSDATAVKLSSVLSSPRTAGWSRRARKQESQAGFVMAVCNGQPITLTRYGSISTVLCPGGQHQNIAQAAGMLVVAW